MPGTWAAGLHVASDVFIVRGCTCEEYLYRDHGERVGYFHPRGLATLFEFAVNGKARARVDHPVGPGGHAYPPATRFSGTGLENTNISVFGLVIADISNRAVSVKPLTLPVQQVQQKE